MSSQSVALTSSLHHRLSSHLKRDDGQEDLAFVLWRRSSGKSRDTAVVFEMIEPRDGERFVHGNVSFDASYFLRACQLAQEANAGVGLIHSHPGGSRWQALSSDDHHAEAAHAAQAMALTGLPLLGMTFAGRDSSYSARVWRRRQARVWVPQWADSVRVVGEQLLLSLPGGESRLSIRYQRRTIDSWGAEMQHIIGSLRIGVAGAGSVGSHVVESLARTGFGDIVILDFDAIEDHNLDRILNATRDDSDRGRLKAELAASAARRHATRPGFVSRWSDSSAVEPDGLALLKDCDIIFSCVDRPAGRQALNALAYAHLIPVVDGGVMVDAGGRGGMRGAEWRAHVGAPGRRCLECLGQYDPSLVQADRDGLLDDSSYLKNLPSSHPLKRNENVFAFSAAAASDQVLAALRMIVAPAGVSDVGAQLTHFTTGSTDLDPRDCAPGCPYTSIIGGADASGFPIGHRHVAAERTRELRAHARRPGLLGSLGRLAATIRYRASRSLR